MSYLYLMLDLTHRGLILPLLCFGWLSSCNDVAQTAAEKSTQERVEIFAQTPFNFPTLSAEAQDLITDWPVFKDFKRISQNLVTIPIEDLKHRSNNLRLRIDSLTTTLPESLNSPIISSRLLVVSTRINLLNQETKKSTPDSVVVEEKLLELHQSIREFVLHINEKVEKDRLDNQGVNKDRKTS